MFKGTTKWITWLGYADQCLLWKVRFLFILTPWSYYSLAFCWRNADEIHNYCNCERLCKLVELGKGEGLWSTLQTATASTSHVFECWAATSLATNTGESQSVVPCGNDVNRSDLVRLIGLRHVEFRARTLYFNHGIYKTSYTNGNQYAKKHG